MKLKDEEAIDRGLVRYCDRSGMCQWLEPSTLEPVTELKFDVHARSHPLPVLTYNEFTLSEERYYREFPWMRRP